jgi:acyl carrier protein
MQVESVHGRIEQLLREHYGCFEEELLASGILDSLRAITFSRIVEREFQLKPGTLRLKDMSSAQALAQRVVAGMAVAC